MARFVPFAYEASSPEGLDRLKATVREQLGRVGVAAPAGF